MNNRLNECQGAVMLSPRMVQENPSAGFLVQGSQNQPGFTAPSAAPINQSVFYTPPLRRD
ncbi:MAG: hypothetical protein KF760_25760 [Candidatus Eremiobacteraeota bacterium]|nr:hypothetical protein [Candidatus Eremiobacteraeota bacterium]MCW5872373.1 hypothetical protein [Candidatus Eremiobacteraeota bacterium]